jgi:hypothetical protein
VSADVRTIATAAGELRVLPLSSEARADLEALFARVGPYENGGREVLALVMQDGDRRMFGLRTGHGHYDGEHAATARRAALYGRMLMPTALVAFARRGFDGVVLAGVCVADNGGGSVQEGELLFVHARAPLSGGIESPPIATWEKFCGPHTTGALFALMLDVDAAWKAAGVPERTLTDMEPCPADLPAVRWFADLVLAGNRFVLVRPELDPADPILGAIAEAGIAEIEYAPSAFLLEGEPPAGD